MAVRPYYDHAGITIYHGDCLEILPELEPVDLVFTSPPYLNQRSYGLDSFDWYAVVPPALSSVKLTKTGQMLVNLGLKHDNGRIVRYWDSLIDACEAVGLRLFGWYVWDQCSGLPGDWRGRLAPSHEWVFHFNRNATTLARVQRCKFAGKTERANTRRKQISDKPIPFDGSGRISERKVCDSVLRFTRAYKADCTEHVAVGSAALAKALIGTFLGATVLDPFMGSGTTLRAAKDLGRRAIGIEIDERYCEIAAKRMAQEVLPLR